MYRLEAKYNSQICICTLGLALVTRGAGLPGWQLVPQTPAPSTDSKLALGSAAVDLDICTNNYVPRHYGSHSMWLVVLQQHHRVVATARPPPPNSCYARLCPYFRWAKTAQQALIAGSEAWTAAASLSTGSTSRAQSALCGATCLRAVLRTYQPQPFENMHCMNMH